MTMDGKTDTYQWDLHHAGTAILGSASRQKLRGGLIQLLPLLPLLLRTLPGTGFFPAQGAKQSRWQPGLVSIPPKTHPGPTLALSGVGQMEPGNFPPKKKNFRARWDQLQNLWGFGGGRGGTDSAKRFLSSIFKKHKAKSLPENVISIASATTSHFKAVLCVWKWTQI